MKHSSRLENDKNASHFPSREVVQQSLRDFSSNRRNKSSQAILIENQTINENEGYSFKEIYSIEKNNEGRFSIWWEDSSGSGKLIFYKITQATNGNLKLTEEEINHSFFVSYTEKLFRVIYRSASQIDEGAWLIVKGNREETDIYSYSYS